MAKVPELTLGNLNRYVLEGLHPGHFLASLLCNNVYAAFEYADQENRDAIGELVYAIRKTPGACWGSPANFDCWIKHHGLKGVV